jgi:hypothetical protein
LTGRPPFNAARPLDTILQVLEQAPVPPRRLNRAVPRDLETVVLKCLEKSPGRRYATAQDLADDLERFLAGKPIHAKPPSLGLRVWRWSRKHLLVTSVSTVTAFALTVAGLVAAYYYRQELLRNTQLVQHVAEMEETIGQERGLARQERQRRAEADRRARQNKALRLAAEARGAAAESPDVSVLLAAEALETIGPAAPRIAGLLRAVLEESLMALEARQAAAGVTKPVPSTVRVTLEIPTLVALARQRVGRSLTAAERERYLLNEP